LHLLGQTPRYNNAMSGRLQRSMSLAAIIVVLLSPHVTTGQVTTGGPPPAVRAIIEGLIQSVNSEDAEAWEDYAQQRFSPALLKSQTVEERRRQFDRIRTEFGFLAVNGVERRGPAAPLELQIKGTKRSGVLAIALDDGVPPRVASIAIGNGGSGGPADPGAVQPPLVNRTMSNNELSRVLDAYFSNLAASDIFSGVALVARSGVPVFHNAYGLADRGRKIANSIRTRFNIGSINKAFTQQAIAQLVREGKLAYSDRLDKFFPEYPQAISRQATVEQLLNHTAGLADFFGPRFSDTPKDRFRSNADYFRFVSESPATFAPGTREQYCNGCYIALGAIIESVSGMPYEKYVEEQIFRRAEMTSSGFPQTDSIESDLAVGYTRRGGGGALRSNVYLHGAAGSAAGGGYATALDLFLYVKAVRAGRFPGADREVGIAGGAPGTNAVVEASDEWVVIIVTNLDPPTGEQIGTSLMRALRR
jgi:D-alanyl-D-alanine carboxypeptidase